MPATVLTLDQVRSNILREIRNQRPDADVGDDSDYYVRASGTASAVEGLYARIAWTAKQIFPDTADEDNLILHARLRGIERKPPVVASGTARAKGKPGVQIASGLSAKYQDGTADLIVGPEVPIIKVVPSEPGALKPGAKVFVTATKSADGTVTATRILTMS